MNEAEREHIYKHTISDDEFMNMFLADPETQREYINASLDEYLEDGDFNMFYKSLECVIKARDSISGFAKKTNLDRSNLYAIFNSKTKPQIETIAKILKELGYTLKVA
jgi:probable addiction module antidote protein